MTQAGFPKVSASSAAEICGRYEPSEGARRMQREGLTPRQFLELLVQAGQFRDAAEFLAHALPRREAIWWACLGVRHAYGGALPPNQVAALKAAVEWVLEPDESRRRLAQAAGEAADFGTPGGCVALAVYASGGSLIAPNLPEVAPEPYMSAQAVSASIGMASGQGDPGTVAALQRELVELGIAIAEGQVIWPVPSSIAALGHRE
jgi:hypothetical protein